MAGADAEAMDKRCLLACSSWFDLPDSLSPSGLPPRGGTTHSDLYPPTLIINGKMLYRLSHRQILWGHFSQLRVPLPKWLSCFKKHESSQHTMNPRLTSVWKQPSCLSIPSSRITGVYHYSQPWPGLWGLYTIRKDSNGIQIPNQKLTLLPY